MPRVRLLAVTPTRRAWYNGRIIGQKLSLLPKQVWTTRARFEFAGNLRDLAFFNVAIDSKLRGCELVKSAVTDLVKAVRARGRVSVIPSRVKRTVRFKLYENTRETVLNRFKTPGMLECRAMCLSQFYERPHISTRKYGRLARDWVTAIGLKPSRYGTHSLRRT